MLSLNTLLIGQSATLSFRLVIASVNVIFSKLSVLSILLSQFRCNTLMIR